MGEKQADGAHFEQKGQKKRERLKLLKKAAMHLRMHGRFVKGTCTGWLKGNAYIKT